MASTYQEKKVNIGDVVIPQDTSPAQLTNAVVEYHANYSNRLRDGSITAEIALTPQLRLWLQREYSLYLRNLVQAERTLEYSRSLNDTLQAKALKRNTLAQLELVAHLLNSDSYAGIKDEYKVPDLNSDY